MQGLNLNKINPNVKLMLLPLMIIIIVGIITFYFVRDGYSQINRQITSYNQEKTSEEVLQVKYNTLTEFDKEVAVSENKILTALPDKSPVTQVIGLVRKLTSDLGLTLTSVSLVSGGNQNISSVVSGGLKITVTSNDITTLISLLRTLNLSAPLTNIQNVNMTDKDGLIISDIDLEYYWSVLPDTIPSITSPVHELADDERKLLAIVNALNSPFSGVILSPQSPKERLNPFD